jgi:hypothetical protein
MSRFGERALAGGKNHRNLVPFGTQAREHAFAVPVSGKKHDAQRR